MTPNLRVGPCDQYFMLKQFFHVMLEDYLMYESHTWDTSSM